VSVKDCSRTIAGSWAKHSLTSCVLALSHSLERDEKHDFSSLRFPRLFDHQIDRGLIDPCNLVQCIYDQRPNRRGKTAMPKQAGFARLRRQPFGEAAQEFGLSRSGLRKNDDNIVLGKQCLLGDDFIAVVEHSRDVFGLHDANICLADQPLHRNVRVILGSSGRAGLGLKADIL
jgi:hypothetical protein